MKREENKGPIKQFRLRDEGQHTSHWSCTSLLRRTTTSLASSRACSSASLRLCLSLQSAPRFLFLIAKSCLNSAAMASINNDSLNSPMANVHYDASMLSQNDAGMVARLLGGLNAWSLLLTIFLGLVVYDQGECDAPLTTARGRTASNARFSHVHLQERLHRRSVMEGAFHRPFP